MKLSNKKIKIIYVVIIVAALVALFFFVLNHIRKNEPDRSHYAQYDACSQDLNMLVEFLQTKYPDPKTRPPYLQVIGDNSLLVPGSGRIELPGPIVDHIRAIAQKGFVSEKTIWRYIVFDGNRIQFDTVSGAYALVYSPEGAPTYLHEPNENFPVLVEHIAGNWYHVTRTG